MEELSVIEAGFTRLEQTLGAEEDLCKGEGEAVGVGDIKCHLVAIFSCLIYLKILQLLRGHKVTSSVKLLILWHEVNSIYLITVGSKAPRIVLDISSI